MKSLATAFSLLTASAFGNPIPVGDWAYIASEHLKISVTGSTAVIDGAFTFRSTSGTGRFDAYTGPGGILIPLWLPDSKNADEQTAQLIKLCSPNGDHKVEGPLSRALQMVIDPRIKASGKELTISSVSMVAPASRRSSHSSDPVFQRKGYCCLLLHVSVPPSLISRGQTVSIIYRQPLFSTKGQSEFHYVPIFNGLPQGSATTDLTRYSLTMRNDMGRPLTLGGVILRPSGSAVLPLSGGDAITLKTLGTP